MPDVSPQMRCSSCRQWIPCVPSNTKVPPHNHLGGGGARCSGSGKRPAEKRGKFDN